MSVVESTVVEASPFVVARAAVRSVELLSPSFARITFGGADLDEFGDPERILDQRIKLIFPPSSGGLPDLRARRLRSRTALFANAFARKFCERSSLLIPICDSCPAYSREKPMVPTAAR